MYIQEKIEDTTIRKEALMENIEHVTKIFIENLKQIKAQVDESKPQIMPLYDAKKDCQDEFDTLKR